jgi:PAS domain S-box-containing protein
MNVANSRKKRRFLERHPAPPNFPKREIVKRAVRHQTFYAPAQAAEISANGHAQAEAKFQTLLESAPDAIVIIDGAGRIVIANHQAERLFGYERDELLGQEIELLLPEQLREIHRSHRQQYATNPRTRPMGMRHNLMGQRKDGSEFPTEVSLSPLRTQGSLLITSVIRDISERVRAEADLRRQTGFVRLLQEVAVTANQASSIEEAARSALDQICAHTGWPIGHVFLPARGISGTLAPTSIWHLDAPEQFESFRAATESQHFSTGDGLIGQVLAEGKPAWVANVAEDRRFVRATEARQAGIRSGFAFPVLVGIEVVAALEFFTTSPSAPDEGLLDVMAHVGTQLGRVVERARAAENLERQVWRRTAHLNTLLEFSQELLPARSLDAVLQRALNHALALAPEAQCGAIYLYDAASDTLALRASAAFEKLPNASLPTTVGAIGRAFTARRTQLASSREEYIALLPDLTAEMRQQIMERMHLKELPTGTLALPLVAHDQAIGALLLLRKTGDGPFVGEALATLEGLANLTAAAILEERSARAAATLSTRLASLEEQQRVLAERLKSADAAILQAARLAAVGQLAAAIAHEINNPLYAARNCLYLLEEEPAERAREAGYLTIAREQLARIAGVIQRMRDFYRPARGDLAPADVNGLIQDTLALAELNTRNAAINIIFTPGAELESVLCNADQLRQVFLNLVLNAIEAMPEGGTLTVRTTAGPTVALIEISDTGIGIPDDIRSHLFEPFFTNKPNGTGLGLSISAHIVTQHGGQLEVESAKGQGSTFRVVLPYQPNI